MCKKLADGKRFLISNGIQQVCTATALKYCPTKHSAILNTKFKHQSLYSQCFRYCIVLPETGSTKFMKIHHAMHRAPSRKCEPKNSTVVAPESQTCKDLTTYFKLPQDTSSHYIMWDNNVKLGTYS